jgi:ATP-binding cassette subfamily F protein 3
MQKTEQMLNSNPTGEQQLKTGIRLADIHTELNNIDTIYPSHKAEKILEGLGFKSTDFEKHISDLSGGWRMRAALAGVLYLNPDLLLLDEPTNYLDMPSVRWLDQFLSDYRGAIILVCHDREFLNRQTGRVLSFEREGIRLFRGNYDQYVVAREDENRRLEAEAKNQEQKVKEARKFIDKFRYKATKASRPEQDKNLEKMEIISTHKSEKSIHFSFPNVVQSGRIVLDIREISKAYGERSSMRMQTLLFRGEKE